MFGQNRAAGARKVSGSPQIRKAALAAGNGVLSYDGLGGAKAVDGSADDAAGVAGAFADGIQPHNAGALSCHVVAGNAHGRAAAGFGTDEGGVLQESPLPA